jgi:hypothetical protein
MRFIEQLCPPALLYLLFLAVNVGLDLGLLNVWTATTKVIFGGAAVYVLDILCRLNLGIVSWFIVATPFIVTAIGTAIALGLQVDKSMNEIVSGKTNPAEVVKRIRITA